MKKFISAIIIIALTIFIIFGLKTVLGPIFDEITKNQYVSDNGWLKVEGTQLKNESNNNFTLKGVSSHGLQWYSDMLTADNIKELKDTWHINVFRIAMYTDSNGYISNKETMKNKLIEVADIAINLDLYVIIDWHTLTDNNPNIHKEEAKVFFDEISCLYKDTPNIIYEICNEPNGNSITWDDEIKPYAEEIIPVIRKNSPNSIIIVGTPSWCKELKPAAENRLKFDNILYSCHFYAATHKDDIRQEVSEAYDKGLPIIVSEWGTTEASGNGYVDKEESKKWIEFLKSKNISFINWSFSNKEENSAIVNKDYKPNQKQDSNSENNQDKPASFNDYLTDSGNLVKSLILSN